MEATVVTTTVVTTTTVTTTHLVNLCLPMNPTIITCQINKKDDFLVEVKRYMKENGSDALEDLIASTVYLLLRGHKSYGNLLTFT